MLVVNPSQRSRYAEMLKRRAATVGSTDIGWAFLPPGIPHQGLCLRDSELSMIGHGRLELSECLDGGDAQEGTIGS